MLPLLRFARSGIEPPSVRYVTKEIVAVFPVLRSIDGSDMSVLVVCSIAVGTDRDVSTFRISVLVRGGGEVWFQVVASPILCVSGSEFS